MPRVGLVGFCMSDGHLDESVCFFGNQTRFQPRHQMGQAGSKPRHDGEIMNSAASRISFRVPKRQCYALRVTRLLCRQLKPSVAFLFV